mgnify:CR=1 FL=1
MDREEEDMRNEVNLKEKLTEGSEVSANSMRPLASAARQASSRPNLSQVSANG